MAQEYGQRYRDKLAGWWVDGSYSFIGYDEEKLGILARALKAGNPGRIIAFNPGVQDKVRPYSRHEDCTCGEQNPFLDQPVTRWTLRMSLVTAKSLGARGAERSLRPASRDSRLPFRALISRLAQTQFSQELGPAGSRNNVVNSARSRDQWRRWSPSCRRPRRGCAHGSPASGG